MSQRVKDSDTEQGQGQQFHVYICDVKEIMSDLHKEKDSIKFFIHLLGNELNG